jgi:hypothetical protein
MLSFVSLCFLDIRDEELTIFRFWRMVVGLVFFDG